MVLSCLVEPLVSPRVGRGPSGPRRSRLSKSRLAATAIMVSALAAVTTNVDAAEHESKAERIYRTAHKRPDPIPLREIVAAHVAQANKDELPAPGEAPVFEWDAIFAHRLKHCRDIVRDQGPGLGLGRRLDRLSSAANTYHLFMSGVHRSGTPYPIS